MILLALGANLPSASGAPRATLERALALIDAAGVKVLRRSRWWSTAASPPGSGPDFVNGAAQVETALAPETLLAALHEIEARLGRLRAARWGARVCDLDLLAWGELVLPDDATHGAWRALPPGEQATRAPDRLILPHPRLQDRGFVLAPLAEVAPDWRHPALGLTPGEMLSALPAAARADLRPIERFPEAPD